jgi:probable phosphoglycerate mutase
LTALTGPVLAGRTPGIALDERGRAQAQALGKRLSDVPLAAVVSSPLDRCKETAQAVLSGRADLELTVDDRFSEVGYGDWTGRELNELAKDPLWRVVQAHPSAVVFPGGEALRDAAGRAVTAVREWNARIGDAAYLVCSHGDIIKAVVADALGLHLDQFQRIHVDPASVTVIRYTDLRPFVVRLNDSGQDVRSAVVVPKAEEDTGRSGDAAVGGGA